MGTGSCAFRTGSCNSQSAIAAMPFQLPSNFENEPLAGARARPTPFAYFCQQLSDFPR
jgi:hypothetical protein